MLIAGEKYACEACVRGHRVSNCQHADRALQHIAKKGRPVSQCTHCRTLRKSRSAHVKCDCGEKAHSKGSCTNAKEGDSKDTCCCSHGGRCPCALKKEHLEAVPESESDEGSLSTPSETRRPRAHTVQSDACGLTVFANGHHKPAHKHTHLAHKKCGLPYVVPRHSIHGADASGLANRSVDNLPHLSNIEALHSESHIKDSIVSAQQEQRKVKSEHGSPVTSPSSNLEQLNSQLQPLDLSGLESYPDFGFQLSLDSYGLLQDLDQPIFSAGLSATSIDWSHYDGLDFNNDNLATSNFSQAPSFTGFDFSSMEQPALTTTSTSGEISEVEDGLYMDLGRSRLAEAQKYGSDYNSEIGDDLYRLSTASSYTGLPQVQMLASNNVSSLDLDELLKNASPSYVGNFNSNSNSNQGPPITFEEKFLPQPAFDDRFLIPADDDDDTTDWMASFVPPHLSNNPTAGGPNHEHVWVQ